MKPSFILVLLSTLLFQLSFFGDVIWKQGFSAYTTWPEQIDPATKLVLKSSLVLKSNRVERESNSVTGTDVVTWTAENIAIYTDFIETAFLWVMRWCFGCFKRLWQYIQERLRTLKRLKVKVKNKSSHLWKPFLMSADDQHT